ncbi:Oxoglutarate/iron-dependent oxygenase [Lasiodiplodia theobromae]|uniref:Oxoglutarate/iron-dependent oxygenase n=1 Tax=Lasiodiplodia theobromae TaxID=45133 RepID=A0A5N5CW46_9PEZI|nr:putative 2-oxoglutarate-dependent dioxygenase [Lasiodiplodia theobromae]KAF9630251.1 Oxoglutarate/iron-dependent oxygenase [Lasiodiplodia theobromae]
MPASVALDASKFTSGSSEERAAYARDLLVQLGSNGYVRLKNHGISSELVDSCFGWSKRFFDLPLEEKVKTLNPPGPNPQRGWSTLGAEKTSTLYGKLMGHDVPDDLKDAREHFDFGTPGDDLFPSRWPTSSKLPGFQPFLEDFFHRCEQVSLDILHALELALDLPPATFRQQCMPNASEFRLNHYPAISAKDLNSDKVERIWPHFDLGVITLLFTDTVGGLEFQDRANPDKFVLVDPANKTEMVVNISETLQRWTAGALPAGLHRVTAPKAVGGDDDEDAVVPERYSIAYFCKAAREARVSPLEPFRAADAAAEEADGMTALEYQQKRLLTAY